MKAPGTRPARATSSSAKIGPDGTLWGFDGHDHIAAGDAGRQGTEP